MPDITNACFNQWAVLWPFTGRWDRFGQPIVGTPVEIPVATWITKRRKAVDPKLGTIALDAVAVVFNPVPLDSHIWLGTLDRFYGGSGSGTGTGSGSGARDDEIMVIKTYTETPDVKGRFSEKAIGMQRLHQSTGD